MKIAKKIWFEKQTHENSGLWLLVPHKEENEKTLINKAKEK